MPSGILQTVLSVAGISINQSLTRTASGQISHEVTLPAGKAGTLTTRTDDNTGVATLSTGHGVTTGMKVDVFWSGGCRYGMEATVATNAVTVDGGAGDVLPAESTAVIVTPRVTINLDVDGDDIKLIGVVCDQIASADFLDSGGASLKQLDLAANEVWSWASDNGVAVPITGNAVDSVKASCGSSTDAATIKIGVLYDSDS